VWPALALAPPPLAEALAALPVAGAEICAVAGAEPCPLAGAETLGLVVTAAEAAPLEALAPAVEAPALTLVGAFTLTFVAAVALTGLETDVDGGGGTCATTGGASATSAARPTAGEPILSNNNDGRSIGDLQTLPSDAARGTPRPLTQRVRSLCAVHTFGYVPRRGVFLKREVWVGSCECGASSGLPSARTGCEACILTRVASGPVADAENVLSLRENALSHLVCNGQRGR
jgi:hypothetical protein